VVERFLTFCSLPEPVAPVKLEQWLQDRLFKPKV
jgi:hypothetical protein